MMLLWSLYVRLSYRPASPDYKGKIMIKPGLMSWAMAAFCLLGVIGLNGLVFNAARGIGDDRTFLLLLGPPLIILFAYAVYVIAWTRVRVNGTHVELRGIQGWTVFEWADIKSVQTHWILGTRLHTQNTSPLPFWPYGYGAAEIRYLFMEAEKPYELA
jgi:hypothetical protein